MATEDATEASGDATTDRPGGPSSTGSTNKSGEPGKSGNTDESASPSGRFARWWSGWRVALRIASRDARRYKWRSALIATMVGLPVLLLTGGITYLASSDVSAAESVPSLMGSAQARISDVGFGRMIQSPDGRSFDSATASGNTSATGQLPALAVPGFATDSPLTAAKVQKLTGGRVIRTLSGSMRITQGDARPRMQILGIDARDPMARGMTTLVSGRWAGSTSEIVVTEAGIARGLPGKGTLTASDGEGKPVQLAVVGVATGFTARDLPSLIALPELLQDGWGQDDQGFLVERPSPVTWSDVRRLNTYGLLVQSHQVLLSPPASSDLPQDVAQLTSTKDDGQMLLLMLGLALFVETTLLAGPAFAVSAARQRRSLAIAASNGAEARQLRRYVLGQALMLGVLSAAVAAAGGVLLTLAGLTWWQAGHADFLTGPLEIPWPRILGVFAFAMIASTVAAMLPARGVARLNIASILAGRAGSTTRRRGLPAAGVAIMAVSAVISIGSASTGDKGLLGMGAVPVLAGALGLVVGAILVIPTLLALLGWLGGLLMLPLRLAARDTAQQRGRSTPAVAAVMAAVAVVTSLGIAAASDSTQGRREYQQQSAIGEGQIHLVPGVDEKAVRSVIQSRAPDLSVRLATFAGYPYGAPDGVTAVFAARPAGCSDAAALRAFTPNTTIMVGQACSSLGSEAAVHGLIKVMGLQALAATTHLSATERGVLKGGGMLVLDAGLAKGGYTEFVTSRIQPGAAGTPAPPVTGHVRVAAAGIDQAAWKSALTDPDVGAWILPEAADKLGWPVTPGYLAVTSPTGMISENAEETLNGYLDDRSQMLVERGFQNDAGTILRIMFLIAGALVLIASLISTALSLAESQNDMATLAAVGATRHTRRAIAASQAIVVSVFGCLLGLLVGLVPGIAITWPLTTLAFDPVTQLTSTQSPIIVIPWLPLLAVCVGVPLLAGALAWSAVRRHPQMTRRLA